MLLDTCDFDNITDILEFSMDCLPKSNLQIYTFRLILNSKYDDGAKWSRVTISSPGAYMQLLFRKRELDHIMSKLELSQSDETSLTSTNVLSTGSILSPSSRYRLPLAWPCSSGATTKL